MGKIANDWDKMTLEEKLALPFAEEEVKFKPAVVTGNRALAMPYVDARVIMDRLDEVFGVGGWEDEIEFLPDGSCVCRLKVKIDGQWISKCDVGGASEQPDEGDRHKAAVSDGLKRAAVKVGIGRYLYRQEPIWADYDQKKKKFAKPPRLPASASRAASTKAQAKPTQAAQPETAPSETAPVSASEKKPGSKLPAPANGTELKTRLSSYDQKLANDGAIKPGDLLKHVMAAGKAKGYDADMANWNAAAAIQFAIGETRAFEKGLAPVKKSA